MAIVRKSDCTVTQSCPNLSCGRKCQTVNETERGSVCRGAHVPSRQHHWVKSYRCRSRSFVCATSCDVMDGANDDWPHINADGADVFDVIDATILMRRPDAANSTQISVSIGRRFLSLYSSMT